MLSKAQIPLGLSRHVKSRLDTTRRLRWTCWARLDKRVKPCCSRRSTQPKFMDRDWTLQTCRVVSRRDVTSQVEFGLKHARRGKPNRYGTQSITAVA